ncbi:septin and tuftelin-interacting protein 1 homolog 1-like [Triticum aestivum]|nr:septin and tuftelin-interacting protein 1 homolog 1-like [Triticum aestivum]
MATMALLQPSFNGALLDKDDDDDSAGSYKCTNAAVAKMMRLWNYKDGSGLGAQGQGIIVPIQPAVRRRRRAGIGHRDKPYDNGLQVAPPLSPVEDDLDECREWEAVVGALRLERECHEKTLTLLREMKLHGDSSVETADALAAIVKSGEVLQGKRALGAWKAALPPSTVRYIVDKVLSPRLAVEAQQWRPSWDPECDDWLRPWIPLIGHLPESLYDVVESKISSAGHDIVRPWKDYFDPAHWELFARRHVLPELTRLMRELRMTPPKQTDSSLHMAMLWAPLLHAEDVLSILEETEFFDKWESALRHWLQSAKPSYGEAVAWCTGWKKLFTPELLADEHVLARLDAGAAMVDQETQDLDSLLGYSW